MSLLDKFEATSIYNGNVIRFTRISQTRFRKEWVEPTTKGNPLGDKYDVRIEYSTEGTIQKWLMDGHLVLTNPATLTDTFAERDIPSTFFFTTLQGTRYTGYIQDDFVTVTWGDGVHTATEQYTLSSVKDSVTSGAWKVLPESYRSRNSAASEFMQYMENCNGPLTTEDRVAICETIVFLNKIMYETENK